MLRPIPTLALGTGAALMALLAACGSDHTEPAQAETACTNLAGTSFPASYSSLPNGGATVESATLKSAEDPGNRSGEYCELHAAIKPLDKSAPDIKVQINLPSDWNHKALHYGGGGFHGVLQTALNHPEGSLLYDEDFLGRGEVTPELRAGPPTPLKQGYVTFGSDSGHQAESIWEGNFALNEEALRNFAVDQLIKTKGLALQLMQKHYDELPERTYFAGGSEGGREAMKLVQEYPHDYDGLIAVYPVLNWIPKALHDNNMVQKLYASSGANWISPEQNELINTTVKRLCDPLDGATDGIVSNISGCAGKQEEILQALSCAGAAPANACLSDGQIEVIQAYNQEKTFDFPLANGFQHMPGYSQLAGADIGILFGTRPVPATPPTEADDALMGVWSDQVIRFMILGDPTLDTLSFNAKEHQAEILAASALLDATNTDISAFQNAGGKLIIIHGTEDQMVTPYGTTDYFETLQARFGQEAVSNFIKFYLIPGFSHGAGTFYSRIDALTALDKWVSTGAEPGTLVAEDQNPDQLKRTRPACQWPAYPHYDGEGDVNSAASFTCTLP